MKIDLNAYKNIIFDLGGVLLNINYHLTINAFKQLGIPHFDELYSQAKQQELFDKYERGELTTHEFRSGINKMFDDKLSNKQIDDAWNALLLDFPKARFQLLEKTKNTHRTFLLSNTTELHIDAFESYLKKDFAIHDFSTYFEKIYLSYKVGMRKPSKEIFELVLTENNLKAHETLFIDDSIQHIETAKSIGIQTYWLDITKESIEDIFI